MKFNESALKFLTDLQAQNGHDLGYSLAVEGDVIFVIIVAQPSMTPKRWNTGNPRIMFLIDEDEYEMGQDELVADLTARIQEHMVLVTDEGVDIFGNSTEISNETH